MGAYVEVPFTVHRPRHDVMLPASVTRSKVSVDGRLSEYQIEHDRLAGRWWVVAGRDAAIKPGEGYRSNGFETQAEAIDWLIAITMQDRRPAVVAASTVDTDALDAALALVVEVAGSALQVLVMIEERDKLRATLAEMEAAEDADGFRRPAMDLYVQSIANFDTMIETQREYWRSLVADAQPPTTG
jgi:hypothetical protein